MTGTRQIYKAIADLQAHSAPPARYELVDLLLSFFQLTKMYFQSTKKLQSTSGCLNIACQTIGCLSSGCYNCGYYTAIVAITLKHASENKKINGVTV